MNHEHLSSDLDTKLATIYYNKGNPNLFKIRVDVTLLVLNDELSHINCWLNHKDIRTVDNVEYRRPLTD